MLLQIGWFCRMRLLPKRGLPAARAQRMRLPDVSGVHIGHRGVNSLGARVGCLTGHGVRQRVGDRDWCRGTGVAFAGT